MIDYIEKRKRRARVTDGGRNEERRTENELGELF